MKNLKISGTINSYLNYKAVRLIKKDNIPRVVESPKILINENNNPENIANFKKKFNKYIDNFILFIQTKNPNINLESFLENLKTLVIEEKSYFFFKKGSDGQYNVSKNKILVRKGKILNSIYHELLHCASRKVQGDRIFVGFNQIDYSQKKEIGCGLNEGYTALLEHNYFHKENSYQLNKIFAFGNIILTIRTFFEKKV